jgi:hypothetical protein
MPQYYGTADALILDMPLLAPAHSNKVAMNKQMAIRSFEREDNNSFRNNNTPTTAYIYLKVFTQQKDAYCFDF